MSPTAQAAIERLTPWFGERWPDGVAPGLFCSVAGMEYGREGVALIRELEAMGWARGRRNEGGYVVRIYPTRASVEAAGREYRV